jgi:GalNAc5-diNAcBac-PP-undecaprenol beta-1,3-glucosyltransferase
MTFFSVIIPVYNRAHLVAETIDSVLQQHYSHFEIIIVDDGSKDNISEIIRIRYGHDDRVKYFYKQNEERGAARNFGLKQATGDFAVFFDSDDWMLPGYLGILHQVITDNPGINLLAAKYNYNNKGKTEYHPTLQTLPEGWYDRDLFLKGNILACNFCIRIKDYDFRFFPPERELASMEDWLFLLANLGRNKVFIKNTIGVTMRQHDERSMNNNQQVIEARWKATGWALNNLQFSEAEKKKLIAWSHYFCGVHQYLDNNRRASVKEALAAMKGDGLQKQFIVLLAKAIAGKKFIKAIR